MHLEVYDTLFQCIQILGSQFCFRHAAVVFQRTNSCDQNHAAGVQTAVAALDVEELLCAQIRAETCLGHAVVAQFQRQLCGTERVAAVRNVGERAAVNQRRRMLQGLYQVRLEGILQQCCHSTVCAQILGINRIAVQIVCHQDLAQAFLQVCQVRCQAQDCHNLGGNGDLESVAPGNTVHLAAQTNDDVPQRTVVHVQHTLEHNPALVDAQHIALLHMVIQHSTQQVVCRSDGVHIAGEVQVDILHGNDLCIAAAGCTALDAEYRTQGRFTQCQDCLLADLVQCVCQTYADGSLALACRCRVDGGHQNQLTVRLAVQLFEQLLRQLCLVVTIVLDIFLFNGQFRCHLTDRVHFCTLCNFDIRQHKFSLLFRIAVLHHTFFWTQDRLFRIFSQSETYFYYSIFSQAMQGEFFFSVIRCISTNFSVGFSRNCTHSGG